MSPDHADLSATVAEHGARLDGHDRDVEQLRAEDARIETQVRAETKRIETSLSGWIGGVDKKYWALVIGIGLSGLGTFGSLVLTLLIYAAIGKAR